MAGAQSASIEQSSIQPVPETNELPHYDRAPLQFADPERVRRELASFDWSFTDDGTGFLTHDIHPYPAKFIPQIPGQLISSLSSRGELVLDPFGGSGTTALEAVRLGRRAVSIDANPVASLIGKVKTSRLDSDVASELAALHASLATEASSLPSDPSVLVGQYGDWIPAIPNRAKWFADTATGELALIRFRIAQVDSQVGRDIAALAMSRMILKVSFQDSETRYKSSPRDVPTGEAITRYLKELEAALRSLERNGSATRYGVAKFITCDIRKITDDHLPPLSADLVVTSPPYGNANDYHLYHRFRLLWLGFDPVALGHIEIGSHLRHQREGSGFWSYLDDLLVALGKIERALKPGRYAAMVIGDAIYDGQVHATADVIQGRAADLGFDVAFTLTRPVHKTKRSFVIPARRASSEDILILRKKVAPVRVYLSPPPYRLFPYEELLRSSEAGVLTQLQRLPKGLGGLELLPPALSACRRLVFTHSVRLPNNVNVPTWQAILENGMAASPSSRKDPKYVTHGIHPYKGKFYPQLGKALLNVTGLAEGSVLFDPFCGSGTTVLEGFLNGLRARGVDMNPLAALIARAKTGILELPPEVVTEAIEALSAKLARAPAEPEPSFDQFAPECVEELERWFPPPVLYKLNWLLKTIRRLSAGHIRDFLIVVLSSIIRDISQQDPTDLRIRYRSPLLSDADVFGLFKVQLSTQFSRLEKFWCVRGYAPNQFHPAAVIEGDSRTWDSMASLGLTEGNVDAVLTSPPYATALPYIDTDRLSLLALMGISGQGRRPLEQNLIGSREILTSERKSLDAMISESHNVLNEHVGSFLKKLRNELSGSDVGFRRKNMPALLFRFFRDMKAVLRNCHRALKVGGDAMIVIGDNKMELAGRELRIPTTDFVESLGESVGFRSVDRFDISVTTENLIHIKNAITQNVVLRLRRA
jgi:DNA modification methylase